MSLRAKRSNPKLTWDRFVVSLLAKTHTLDVFTIKCYHRAVNHNAGSWAKYLVSRSPDTAKNMFAVIKTGGKQYVVREGQELAIEKLDLEEGKPVEFEVLLLADAEGKDVKVGTPLVQGAKVKGKVIEQGRDKKVSVIKFKSKSRYRRNVGHRQPFTKVKIEKITA